MAKKEKFSQNEYFFAKMYFYFVKGLRQKIMQFSQVCAKVRKLKISKIFQKYS